MSSKENINENPCLYPEYQCRLQSVNGYSYCIRHILEDKSAPFKQCTFKYQNTKHKCFKAAPLNNKNGLCQEHAAQSFQQNQSSSSKAKSPETADELLDELSHHRKLPITANILAVPDPSSVPSLASKALKSPFEDCDETDIESVDVTKLPRLDDDSDVEVESDFDALDHADIFTSEEVVRIYTQKLQKLKEFYEEEFKHLRRELKDNRREYLRNVKTERDLFMNIKKQPKDTFEEQEAYKELLALSRYQKNSGIENVMSNHLYQKQLNQVSDVKSPVTPSHVKCIYSEGSYKCRDKTVPMSKYCFKHILSDPHQVLFKKCNSVGSVEECSTPVAQLPNTESCVLHLPEPPLITMPNNLPKSEVSDIDSMPTRPFIVSELPPKDVMEGDCS